MIGQTLSHFRITAKLGEGGMGEVYRAEDTRLGREVAIKVLPEEMAGDPERLERFQREAKALAALDHPNIVTIHAVESTTREGTSPSPTPGVGEVRRIDFLVMGLVEGKSLDKVIPGGGLQSRQLFDLAIQTADALAAAHAKGITHRDLKPSNVMVTDQGRVKILDFGLAKLTGTDTTEAETELMTQDGLVMGTVPYMSPEQVQGGEVDHRSDVFSFGILLYEMATGKRPFQGENNAAVISSILRDEPDTVSSIRDELPNHLGRIIKRCLTKEPERRPQSALDIRNEIEELSREVETGATPSSPAPEAPKKTGRWIAAAALLIAIAALGFWWQSRPGTSSDASEWVQLTHFTDSVTSPAISPDGRMVAYLRGASTFLGAADLYVQMLADGEPVRLTNDGAPKMTPSFSLDGSRIAYSKTMQSTWAISVLGGENRELMTNASELSWVGDNRVMFSEFREGLHMAVVTSTESRSELRDVYVPVGANDMAHRSYLSPDGESVLLAEMDDDGWTACRVVPFDGSSMGQTVGPPEAPCVSGAWTPDGRYVYLTIELDNEFHIWRQRFPRGTPEQVTFGPTQQEGIAMSPDGDFFVTSAGTMGDALWIGSGGQEEQMTFQGQASRPVLTADGRTLYYLESRPGTDSQIMRMDLDNRKTEPVLPGFNAALERIDPAAPFDISADGKSIALATIDDAGNRRLWYSTLGQGDSPVQLPADLPSNVRLGPEDTIFYADGSEGERYAFRVEKDGSNRQKVLDVPLIWLEDISADGQWVTARISHGEYRLPQAPAHDSEGFVAVGTSVWAYRIDGTQEPQLLCNDCFWAMWGPEERYMYFQTGAEGTWVALPIPEGETLPDLPAGGIPPDAAATALGQTVVEGKGGIFMSTFYPGPDPSIYATSRPTAHRNLYRIPIH